LTPAFDGAAFVKQLNALLATLPADPETPGVGKAQLTRLRKDIGAAIDRLASLSKALDYIKQPPVVFDPSDPHEIGNLIARTLLLQQRHPLASLGQFYGSGVYAIYYAGDFPAYSPISGTDHPIYVGKVDPADHGATTVEQQGPKLFVRLNDHRKSVDAAKNLALENFECRFLVVKSAWQNTAEDYLIDWFKPVWNNEMKVCFGFGKHGDSADTRRNRRSPWDTIHPGRSWATDKRNVKNLKSPKQIIADVAAHYDKFPPRSAS